ncbi:MAG: 39S ribosomal protein L28, mitochondrial [Paramarteilia canceri]
MSVVWSREFLRSLKPEIRNGLYELPVFVQKMLLQRHRSYVQAPNLYTDDQDTNSEYLNQNGDLTKLGIPVIRPALSSMGLWGGEGLVKGYITYVRNLKKGKNPRLWIPKIIMRTFYSEILDKHYNIHCTHKTLDLVDENFGFDFYILKTEEALLFSKLGMDLKRMMLLRLLDEELSSEIKSKYKQFIMCKDEAQFVGLSIAECIELNRKLRVSDENSLSGAI